MIWAAITVATNYQIGYMAVAVGLLVGFTVRYFGSGIDVQYGVIGAFFALFGCGLGNLASQLIFIANTESLAYMEVLAYLNVSTTIAIMQETFAPMDLLFYGIAAYEGFKFSFRKLSQEEVNAAAQGKVLEPAFNKFRLPAVAVLFVALAAAIFFVRNGNTLEKKYYYESGAMNASGIIQAGMAQGEWKYWWENGQPQMSGSYLDGKMDGGWVYYDEEGNVAASGPYKSGLQHGKWQRFYPGGSIVNEEGTYDLGREEGTWSYYDEKGNISKRGSMMMGQPHGKWEFFHPSGKLSTQGEFNNGKATGTWISWNEAGAKVSESVFEKDVERLMYYADESGKVIIADGNGNHSVYSEDSSQVETGAYQNGYRTGKWLIHYTNDQIREEREYKHGVYTLTNYWLENGTQLVRDGDGEINEQFPDGSPSFVGYIKNGKRHGAWTSFYMEDEIPSVKETYNAGVLDGPFVLYYPSGSIKTEGAFSKGLHTGKWTWYFEDNTIESSVSFIDGNKEGVQETYNADGVLLKKETFEKGIRKSVVLE